VAETHVDVADAHFGTGALGAERNGDAFVGLNVENEAVGIGFAPAKNDVRSALELDDDFGGALGEAFAGAQIKRDVRPTPVVDEKFGSDKSFGTRLRTDVLFLSVTWNGLAADGACGVLTAHY